MRFSCFPVRHRNAWHTSSECLVSSHNDACHHSKEASEEPMGGIEDVTYLQVMTVCDFAVCPIVSVVVSTVTDFTQPSSNKS